MLKNSAPNAIISFCNNQADPYDHKLYTKSYITWHNYGCKTGYKMILNYTNNGNTIHYCAREFYGIEAWYEFGKDRLENLGNQIMATNSEQIFNTLLEYSIDKIATALVAAGGIAGIAQYGPDFISFTLKVFASGIIPASLINLNHPVKILLKNITGRDKLESAEKLITGDYRKATEQIAEFITLHPEKWLYLVQSPARCLDHKENGDKLIGQKEEVKIYNDGNNIWYECLKNEPTPIERIENKLHIELNKIATSLAFSMVSGALSYALTYLYMAPYSGNFKFGISSGIAIGTFLLTQDVYPSTIAINYEQLDATRYIEQHKDEKDLYLVQAPGACSEGDALVEIFPDEGLTKWQVCEILEPSMSFGSGDIN